MSPALLVVRLELLLSVLYWTTWWETFLVGLINYVIVYRQTCYNATHRDIQLNIFKE